MYLATISVKVSISEHKKKLYSSHLVGMVPQLPRTFVNINLRMTLFCVLYEAHNYAFAAVSS